MSKKTTQDNATAPEDINDLLTKIAVATQSDTANIISQPTSNIELTNKVVDTLFDMVKRKMLGILNKRQISGIKKLYLINDIIFDNKRSILTRIIDNEIDLSVSESGKGRDQLVQLTKIEEAVESTKGFKRYLQ